MNLAVSRSTLSLATEQFRRRLGEAIDLKNQKRYGESARILKELRRTHPASASVHGLLGFALWQQNDLVNAVHSFEKAVQLAPQSELASLGLFHTLLETGDKKGASREMDRFRRLANSKEYQTIAKEIGVLKTRQKKGKAPVAGADPLKTILTVKSFAAEVGGLKKLKELVDALSN